MKKITYVFLSLIIVSTILLLSLAIKGQRGNPIYFQQEKSTRVGGPFETSGSNSRYALTEAIVEDRTLFFDEKKAKFSAPDIVYFNEKYFSLFTPGVSFIGVPFYLLGKTIGFPQLFTYLSTTILAFINMLLVIKLARKIQVGVFAAVLSGFIFLFATNALVYSNTFIQHHASTLIILFTLLNALASKRTFLNNLTFGVLFGLAILIDFPNIIIISPVLIYLAYQHLQFQKNGQKFNLSFKLNFIGVFIGLLPFFIALGLYNRTLTGSYITLGQNIGRSNYPASQKLEVDRRDKNDFILVDTPFNPRDQINGLYILLISNERGLLYFSPILIIGLTGLILLYRDKNLNAKKTAIVFSSVAGVNLIIYSMFGDPWGGWSFGPRYLIPAAAVLSITIGLAVKTYRKNIFFLAAFFILLAYSLAINTLGAITTTQIPPKNESENLPSRPEYTYKYNWQLIDKKFSSSLIFNLFLSDKITARTFMISFYSMSLAIAILIYLLSYKEESKVPKND